MFFLPHDHRVGFVLPGILNLPLFYFRNYDIIVCFSCTQIAVSEIYLSVLVLYQIV